MAGESEGSTDGSLQFLTGARGGAMEDTQSQRSQGGRRIPGGDGSDSSRLKPDGPIRCRGTPRSGASAL